MKFRIHCNFLSHSCRKLPAPQKTAFRCKLYMHINHLLFIGSFLALLCLLQNWPCIHLHLIIWEMFELPFLVVGHTFCTVAVVRCIFASGELTDHHLWLEFKGWTSFWCWKFKVWSWKCKVCRKMFKSYGLSVDFQCLGKITPIKLMAWWHFCEGISWLFVLSASGMEIGK